VAAVLVFFTQDTSPVSLPSTLLLSSFPIYMRIMANVDITVPWEKSCYIGALSPWGKGAQLPDRMDELRKRAAECLTLARWALLLEVRAGLILLAQKLHQMAESEPAASERLDQAIGAFNDDQMAKH
jgi:hypothetical protein